MLFTKYYSGDKEEVMGRKCGMYDRKEKCKQGFWVRRVQSDGNLRKVLAIDGDNIKIDLKATGLEGMNSIHLA